jgi:prepilin-type N-terminal cleavage/methylation domain-containing protein
METLYLEFSFFVFKFKKNGIIMIRRIGFFPCDIMKKNGFTLIELLAVIVILLIIVIVSTPNIINLINKSDEQKKVTIEERIKMLQKNM